MKHSRTNSYSGSSHRSTFSAQGSKSSKAYAADAEDSHMRRSQGDRFSMNTLVETTTKLQRELQGRNQENMKLMEVIERKEDEYQRYFRELESQYADVSTKLRATEERKAHVQRIVWKLREESDKKTESLKELEKKLSRTLKNFEDAIATQHELDRLQRDNEDILRKLNSLDQILQEAQSKANELESRNGECKGKTELLEAELTKKESEILYMEGEYSALSRKLGEKTSIIQAVEQGTFESDIQKKQLAIEVEHIRLENGDLMHKFDHMKATNNEKIKDQENIVQLIEIEMMYRFKNLAVKNLVKRLNVLVLKDKKLALGKINLYVFKNIRKARAAISFSQLMERIVVQNKKAALQVIRNQTLQWTKCQEINNALSEDLAKRRMATGAYLVWRDEFGLALEDNLRFSMASTALQNVINTQTNATLKRGLRQWQEQAHFQKRVRVFLRHLFWRQHKNTLRAAYNKWVFSALEEERTLLRDVYEQEMFKTRIMNCAFSQLKRNRDVYKKVRNFRLRTLFTSWKRWINSQKHFQRLENFFTVRNRARLRLKLHCIFTNWKQETIKSKVNQGKEAFKGVNERNREVITQHIDVARKACLDNRKKCVRMMYSLLTTKPRKALLKWHGWAIYKTSVFRNAANMWYLNRKQSQLQAFAKWRVFACRQNNLALNNEIAEQYSQIHLRQQSLEQHKQRQESLMARNRVERVEKLGKLLKYIDSRLLLRGFNTYRSNYRTTVRQEQRIDRLFRVFELYFLRHGFFQIRTVHQNILAEDRRERRVEKIWRRKDDKVVKKHMEAWKQYSAVQKRIKSILNRMDLKIAFFVRRKKFNQWRRSIVQEKEAVFREKNVQLEGHISNIHESIKRVQGGNDNLVENIGANRDAMKATAMKIWNYLWTKDVTRIQKVCLYSWRQKAGYISRVEKSYTKLGRLLETKNKRAGLSNIIHYVFVKKINLLYNDIEKMSEQKKQLRLNLGALTTSSTNEAEKLHQQIIGLEQEISSLTTKKENIVTNFSHHTATVKTRKYYKACFSSWKKLFLLRKACCEKLDSVWARFNSRILYINLRAVMEEEQAKQRSERLARKVLNRWMNRRVLAALHTWKSQMMLHTSHYGQENRKRAEEELSKHKKNMEGYVVRQMDNMDVRRRLTTTRDVFATWKARWAHKKSQDAKVKSAKQKLAHGKQKRVIQALRDRTEYQKKLRRFEKRLKSFDTRTVLEKYFKSLKELMKVPKVMAKKVVLFAEKMKFLMKAEAFRRVSEYKIEKEGNMRGKLRDMCTTIQSAQREVDKMWLVVAFGEILRISRRRSLRGTILMNKMANLQKTLLRKSFNQITFFSKIQRTIIKNNYIGPQAQENQRLARKAKSLRRFFTKEGYTDQEVNDHIKVKDSRRVAFVRLKTLVVEEEKPENPFLLHRMFKKWTHYTKDSVLLKKFIKTIENYKYKSELYHPFKVWKSATKHEVQAPKPEMLRMLKHQTEQVKRLAAERTAKAEAVENLRAQHDYYSNYQPGIKKIAIFTFTRAFSKTMKGHMQRWKSYVNACQEEEYRQLIGGADSKIKELEDLLFVKHEAIKMIQDENKNIREVCFEGTKTAKELKALMEERDKVSVSLTDKIAYIQELLQENAILNNKIKTAQQEAIQLLALTKQFTGDETPR